MRFKGFQFQPRLWPTVMTIPMLIILCLLGNWQVERLNWKLGLIEQLETRHGLPAVPLPATIKDTDDWVYRHATVTGRFLYMREMPLYSVGPDGRPGYDLFTPLLTSDDRVVIVNRGWVPEALKEPSARPGTLVAGEIALTGVLRKSWVRERFSPDNDLAHNIWYYADLAGMTQAQDLENVFPMFLYADIAPGDGQYPIGDRTRLNIVNNHLDYAMTWYGLALVLLVIYFIFHIRRIDPGRPEA